MTGVEAIANGVPAFKDPAPRNAAGTLVTLAVILGALFLGVTYLGDAIHARPSDQASVIAQIGRATAGSGPAYALYVLVQVSSAVILILAANTSFNGFPLLAAIIARDGYLPHQFVHRGSRLAYSNGIVVIGVLALVLIALFNGSTHALIPLFAIGVFLCFTLSQAGMVRHWLVERGRGWRLKLAVNGLGAATTAVVTAVVVTIKFGEGAWLVVLIVPALMYLFTRIHRHYQEVVRELATETPTIPLRPQDIKHTVLVPIADLNLPALQTLAYARSITEHVIAVYLAEGEEDRARMRQKWNAWRDGDQIPLTILDAPFRHAHRRPPRVCARALVGQSLAQPDGTAPQRRAALPPRHSRDERPLPPARSADGGRRNDVRTAHAMRLCPPCSTRHHDSTPSPSAGKPGRSSAGPCPGKWSAGRPSWSLRLYM